MIACGVRMFVVVVADGDGCNNGVGVGRLVDR